MESKNFQEESINVLFNTIVNEQVEREKLQREERAGKLRMEHELELKKLKIQELENYTVGDREYSNETSI